MSEEARSCEEPSCMACGDAGCPNCDAGDPSENAYWVETETPGCPSCGNHTLYRVVHLDIKGEELCHSVMYEDKEIAEELAENLSAAYDLGFSKGQSSAQTDGLNHTGLTRKQLTELVLGVLGSCELIHPSGQVDCEAKEVAATIAEWLDRAGHIRCSPVQI